MSTDGIVEDKILDYISWQKTLDSDRVKREYLTSAMALAQGNYV